MALAVLSAACTKYESEYGGTHGEHDSAEQTVEFLFTPTDMQVVSTRAADQVDANAVGAIHLYLFGPKDYYFNIAAGQTSFTASDIRVGTYTVYAVANQYWGMVPGLTRDEVENFAFSCTDLNFRPNVVMSCKQTLVVEYDPLNTTQTLRLELVRAVAKLQFFVTVPEWMNNERLYYKMCNVPDICYMFDEPGNTERVAPGTNFTVAGDGWVQGGNDLTSSPTYFPENRAGTAAGGSKDRGFQNAPENAMYLLVRVKTADAMYDYRIYFGNNDTDDYNVTRNTSYVYHVQITGASPTDLRVSRYSMEMKWNTLRSYFSTEDYFDHVVSVYQTPFAYSLSLRIECLKGDWNYLTSRGAAFVNGVRHVGLISDYNAYSSIDYDPRIRYQPPLFTADNSLVRLRYVLTDQYGVELSYQHDYQCGGLPVGE